MSERNVKLSVFKDLRKAISVDMQLVRALVNPTRIRILDALAEGAASPCELAETLGERVSIVRYHVTVLRSTGCIHQVEAEQSGPAAERSYQLAPEATPTRHIAPGRLMRSGFGHPPAAVVRSIVERGMSNPGTDIFGSGRDQLSCASIVVDAQGWREISTMIAKAVNRISIAHEKSAQRLSDSGEKGISATIAVASFESGRQPRRLASG
jgi:DNA-binding transcriptional ArsR family regulator